MNAFSHNHDKQSNQGRNVHYILYGSAYKYSLFLLYRFTGTALFLLAYLAHTDFDIQVVSYPVCPFVSMLHTDLYTVTLTAWRGLSGSISHISDLGVSNQIKGVAKSEGEKPPASA